MTLINKLPVTNTNYLCKSFLHFKCLVLLTLPSARTIIWVDPNSPGESWCNNLPQALKCSRVQVASRLDENCAAGYLSPRMSRVPMLPSALVLPVGDIHRLQHNMSVTRLRNAIDRSKAWWLFECPRLYYQLGTPVAYFVGGQPLELMSMGISAWGTSQTTW